MIQFVQIRKGAGMGKVQYLIAAVGAIGFVWFAGPAIARGILNIGNITGMAVFGLLLFYGIYRIKINGIRMRMWEQQRGKVFLIFLAMTVMVIAATAIIETVCMVGAAMNRPPENVTAVVLGCSVKGTNPSTILKERMDAAFVYLQENPSALCILSGGQGPGEDISEAECMYRYLTEQGIESGRLLLEDKSVTTEENLLFSKEILNERGLGNRITIVTSEFHSYRAGIMAEKIGLESYSTPSSTMILYLPTYYVRELYGILYYMIAK